MPVGIIRTKISCAAWISLSLTGSQHPNRELCRSYQICSPPKKERLLIRFISLLVGLSPNPVSPWIIDTSQSHLPVGTRGHLTLLLLKSLPPTAPHLLVHCSQVQPMCSVACCMMSSPRLWAYVINKLLSIIRLVSGVTCLAVLYYGEHRIPLSPIG